MAEDKNSEWGENNNDLLTGKKEGPLTRGAQVIADSFKTRTAEFRAAKDEAVLNLLQPGTPDKDMAKLPVHSIPTDLTEASVMEFAINKWTKEHKYAAGEAAARSNAAPPTQAPRGPTVPM